MSRTADTPAPVRITFDGRDYDARPGESLAAALLRAGVPATTQRHAPGPARGAFCWMGWCQECRVRHRGRWVEACRLTVYDGLTAEARRAADVR
ncbi:(2Fe-2S)-binding protein [Rhodobacteraceae bacterium CCMM004]|nr:(2Fe-2S)-binding protein [Rhodobacteraceae bacterium CCMM004]